MRLRKRVKEQVEIVAEHMQYVRRNQSYVLTLFRKGQRHLFIPHLASNNVYITHKIYD